MFDCALIFSDAATTDHFSLFYFYYRHFLLYNGNKSFSMCFKPSTIKFTRPWLTLLT